MRTEIISDERLDGKAAASSNFVDNSLLSAYLTHST